MVQKFLITLDETHCQAIGNDNFALIHGQIVVGDGSKDVGTLTEFLLNFLVSDLACHDPIVAHRHVVIVWCKGIIFHYIVVADRLRRVPTNHIGNTVLLAWSVYEFIDVFF